MDITCANPRAKWRKAGTDAQIFKTENDDPRPKYYVLEMFPYPPGRIHMGYVRNYPMGDVARAIGPRAASSRAESPLVSFPSRQPAALEEPIEWLLASFSHFFVRRVFRRLADSTIGAR